MIILGLETSTNICGVGIADANQIIAETRINIKNIHDRILTQCIQQLCGLIDLPIDEISAIAVSAGPGSFTGLRIGMGVAQGLAFGKKRPVIPVNTLLAQATSVSGTVCSLFKKTSSSDSIEELPDIVPVIKSRRGEIYIAKYRPGIPLPKRLNDEQVLSIDNVNNIIEAPSVVCGNGIEMLMATDCLDQLKTQNVKILENALLGGGLIAQIGQIKFSSGDVSTPNELEPTYIQAFQPGPVK